MSDGTYQLDLSSSTQADVAHSNHLDAVARSFGATARVQRARAMTDNRQVACDFTKSSASTTSNVVPLTELLGVSLPLLRPMQPPKRAALLELLRPLVDPDALPLDVAAEDNEQLALPMEHPNDSERPAGDR
jgi:hypothetical protein